MPVPFHEHDYWATRFQSESSFEWLMPWSVLSKYLLTRDLLLQNQQHNNHNNNQKNGPSQTTPTTTIMPEILNIGCGNSFLPLDLYKAGFQNVTSVDFVKEVVDRMRIECHKAVEKLVPNDSKDNNNKTTINHSSSLKFLQVDCLDMQNTLPLNHYDFCIDKSTSDAICCGDDEGSTRLRKLCHQVARVVKKGGIWCVLSYSEYRQYEWPPLHLESELEVDEEALNTNQMEMTIEMETVVNNNADQTETMEKISTPSSSSSTDVETAQQDTRSEMARGPAHPPQQQEWKTERIEKILVQAQEQVGPGASFRPDIYFHLYVNRRL